MLRRVSPKDRQDRGRGGRRAGPPARPRWPLRGALAVLGMVLGLALAGPAAAEGRYLELSTAYGTTFEAYEAGPPEAEAAVLLLHDRWGFSPALRRAADRLGEAGFLALAVDLFDGRRPEDARRAEELYRQVDPVWVEADVAAALEHLRRPGRALAVVGWGYGADRARELLARPPGQGGGTGQGAGQGMGRVRAAALLYPRWLPQDAETLARLPEGLLILLAARAPVPTAEEVAVLRREAAALGRPVALRRLPGRAGFAQPRDPAYDPRLAEEAFQAVQAFLAWRLQGRPLAAAGGLPGGTP